MDHTSGFVPFADEASLAHLAYNRWEQAEAESMAEYVYRRRTVDLAFLVRQAIQEELTEKQRQLIQMRYEDNRSPSEIARRTGLHPSTVTRDLQLAEKTLRHALRYVVEYQHGSRDDALVPLAVRDAMVVSAARHAFPHTFAKRLHTLRVGENLPVCTVSQIVRITQPRFLALENGDTEPTAGELLRLSAFFGVTVDALLKGDAA